MGVSTKVDKKMERIINALREAGYDPVRQLVGYFQTGNPSFITRKDNDRAIIQTIDKAQLEQYIEAIRQKAKTGHAYRSVARYVSSSLNLTGFGKPLHADDYN